MVTNWRQKLRTYVKQGCTANDSSHDFYHFERVERMALKIGKAENADLSVLSVVAYLHDFYASENYRTHLKRAVQLAQSLLPNIGFPKLKIPLAVDCIKFHETYDWKKRRMSLPIEVLAFQDADRLDAIGALGIARGFYFAGFHGNPIWHPREKISETYDYKKLSVSAISHFQEKLLKVADAMNTEIARKIALRRHKFMEKFLNEFFVEWHGVR